MLVWIYILEWVILFSWFNRFISGWAEFICFLLVFHLVFIYYYCFFFCWRRRGGGWVEGSRLKKIRFFVVVFVLFRAIGFLFRSLTKSIDILGSFLRMNSVGEEEERKITFFFHQNKNTIFKYFIFIFKFDICSVQFYSSNLILVQHQ